MKVLSVIFAFAILTTAFAFPANNDEVDKKPKEEVDFVPLEAQRPGAFPPDGVIDVDANGGGFFGNPFGDSPFPSIFDNFNALINSMRQQFNHLLGRLPQKPGDSFSPELHIPNVGDIDLGKGNTTSVTKIINGHKVTINETEYKQDNGNGGSYFKVRVVDVHPDSAEASPKDVESVLASKDRESMENTDNNEIPKLNDNEALKPIHIETFDEVDSTPTHDSPNLRRNIHWIHPRPVENIEDNSLNSELIPPPDLSNDIYINQLAFESGAPTNPDAEVFDVPQEPPKQTAPLTYSPVQFGNVEPHNFDRFRIPPTFDNNIPFIPQPFPVNNNPPFIVPNYMAPVPNFPAFQPNFPPSQIYLPRHYLPVQAHSQTQRDVRREERGTTHENTVNTQTDANAST